MPSSSGVCVPLIGFPSKWNLRASACIAAEGHTEAVTHLISLTFKFMRFAQDSIKCISGDAFLMLKLI